MAFVNLDRRFVPWDDNDPAEAETRLLMGRLNGDLGWPDLLQKRRVIVLAEAGAGKTNELTEQAKSLRAEGKFVFIATVEDVAHDGLPNCLPADQAQTFEEWKRSNDPAWIFVDSIDEAKLSRVRLERAFRRLAEGIHGAAGRAHVVVSGRYTDWDHRADLAKFVEHLSVPSPKPTETAVPTPDEALTRIVRRTPRRAAKPQEPDNKPLVVLMTPLDPSRISKFVAAHGVDRREAFMEALEARGLRRLAARPLDLNWLVDYWRRNWRFGRFGEMLATGLAERLKETNQSHRRDEQVTTASAMDAVERIGATLSFCQSEKLATPDLDASSPSPARAIDLAAVLPDWTPEQRQQLIAKAVFDPATFGCIRLHNDNEGVVRSYLAARWLLKRRQSNCSIRQLFALLFAETYGFNLIRPAMRKVAAWLSIWDADVAREVLRRDPGLLLSAGDPESLPSSVRQAALVAVIERIASSPEGGRNFDRSNLQRLAAAPDLEPAILTAYETHGKNVEVRLLLLRLIELGRLGGCVEIASECAFDQTADALTRIYAGSALLEVADKVLLSRYSEMIKRDAQRLPGTMLWDSFDHLFPSQISIDELMGLLAAMDPARRDEHFAALIHGPRLAAKLNTRSEVESFLVGLLDLMGERSPPAAIQETEAERAYRPSVESAALRHMQLAGPNEAPDVALDAAIRLYSDRTFKPSTESAQLQEELHKSPSRRRLAFWRSVRALPDHPFLQGETDFHASHLEIMIWSPNLQVDDLGWLLDDAMRCQSEGDRGLAVDVALAIWARNGRSEAMRAQIWRVAELDAATRELFNSFMDPPRASEQQLKFKEQMAELDRQHQEREAEAEITWGHFIRDMRADPTQILNITHKWPESVDYRLYNIWTLLTKSDSRDWFEIDDTSSLTTILGPDVTSASQSALMHFWRHWRPTLESDRAPSQRNIIKNVDCMGFVGVSIEAKANQHWAARLTPEEATQAARYATIDLTGLPPWLPSLLLAWPSEGIAVLLGEVKSELDNPTVGGSHTILDDLAEGPSEIAEAVAHGLFAELVERTAVPSIALLPVLDAIARGLTIESDRSRFAAFALSRASETSSLEVKALYLGAAFHFDAEAAATALSAALDALSSSDQTELGTRLLPRIFGSRIFAHVRKVPQLRFDTLEQLVGLAFRMIRTDEDNRRPSGVVYSSDRRDVAEEARNLAFNQLSATPGRATFAALLRLAELPDFPISAERLRRLAFDRATGDSDHAPWPASEAYERERVFDAAPRTAADLQSVALQRIDDIQHDLLNGDFAQDGTLRDRPDEREVQKWVAEALRSRQGRAYSVERESHVVDEKEPDIRLRAKESDASLPIEIKVAESWSLHELEVALTVQLNGRYLRAHDANYGVLLLIHKQARSKGWLGPSGDLLDFAGVVKHLERLAAEIAEQGPHAPQSRVAVLNVSERGGGPLVAKPSA